MARFGAVYASVSNLRTCARTKDLNSGFREHADILKGGLLDVSSNLVTALISMYAKCGALQTAKNILTGLPFRNTFSWSALISGYAQQGRGKDALVCLECMQQEGLSPTTVTFISVLQACGNVKAVDKGQQIHDEIARQKLLESNHVLGNALVAMYAKCGSLSKAWQVLEELPFQDVAAWSALIGGYVDQGQSLEALCCQDRMQQKGLSPSTVTYTCIFRACGNLEFSQKGQETHAEICRLGLFGTDIMLDNAVLSMYARCGMLGRAREVLEALPCRDVFSWSTLITGYTQQGEAEEALECFELMRCEGLFPDAVIFTSLLRACGSIGAAGFGKIIHEEIADKGLLEEDIVLGTALVDMYAKCGELCKARKVLEEAPVSDVVSWSALIAGYAQQGYGEDALKCLKIMQDKGVSPNAVTYASVLKACGSLGAHEQGEEIHEEIAKQGFLTNDAVLGNALVDMYLKCGDFAKAYKVRNELLVWDVVSWSSLIAGYVQHGEGEKALKCFGCMQREGIVPDAVTFISVLQACSLLGAIVMGKQIHNEILRKGLTKKACALDNALVDMYVKCGALSKAQQVFNELLVHDVVVWSAMMAGYAQQGKGWTALKCFEQMQHKGLFADPFTVTSVLSACSHSGLVEEGQNFLVYIIASDASIPNLEQYTCLVDLFGRAGLFEEAIAIIREMPSSDDLVAWSALLSSCRILGDVNVGKWAFEHAIQVDTNYASTYVNMANLYMMSGYY